MKFIKQIMIISCVLCACFFLYELGHGEAFKPQPVKLPLIKPYTYTVAWSLEQKLFAVSQHYTHYQINLYWLKQNKAKLGL